MAARTISAASAGPTVDPENPCELRHLARSLIEDGDRRRRLGAAGLAYARANFEINDIAGPNEQIFSSFCQASTGLSHALCRVERHRHPAAVILTVFTPVRAKGCGTPKPGVGEGSDRCAAILQKMIFSLNTPVKVVEGV